MGTFEFEGVKYRFDANKAYDTRAFICLPDGRLLAVTGGWLESLPPIPTGLEVVPVVTAEEVPKAA
jgi:hypothetical protein